MDELTFNEFADFIRDFWRVSPHKQIEPDTQFERELGLTGDDGGDLLGAAEKRFGVKLVSEEDGIRKTFNLGPNEYLFHSEGWELLPAEFTTLFGSGEPTVRKFKVGELYEAVRNVQMLERSGRDTN